MLGLVKAAESFDPVFLANRSVEIGGTLGNPAMVE